MFCDNSSHEVGGVPFLQTGTFFGGGKVSKGPLGISRGGDSILSDFL